MRLVTHFRMRLQSAFERGLIPHLGIGIRGVEIIHNIISK